VVKMFSDKGSVKK